jgi:hypothetical protein
MNESKRTPFYPRFARLGAMAESLISQRARLMSDAHWQKKWPYCRSSARAYLHFRNNRASYRQFR